MCGIVATLMRHQRRPAGLMQTIEQKTKNALDAMIKRGPDGWGIWQNQRRQTNHNNDKNERDIDIRGETDIYACLGHRRLAIRTNKDDNMGAQPIAIKNRADSRFSVVGSINGEFYQWQKIRNQLIATGTTFCTTSDSEIAIQLYHACRLRGLSLDDTAIELANTLRGEYAIVIYDEREQSLLAMRDPFGIKPLVYTELHTHNTHQYIPKERRHVNIDEETGVSGIAISSTAKALWALGAVRPALDDAAVLQALSLQYVLPDETLFSSIKQIPVGFAKIVSYTESTSRTYTTRMVYLKKSKKSEKAKIQIPAQFTTSYAEATQRVKTLLQEAVAVRLDSRVPVCVQLSGGIDSTMVAALSQKPCFTIQFPDGGIYDESHIAQESAKALGVPIHLVPATRQKMADVLDDAVYEAEGLAINAHLPAKYLLSDAMRQSGFAVALTGEGSDEVFAGYPHLRQDLLLQNRHENQHENQKKNTALQKLFASNPVAAAVMLAQKTAQKIPTEQETREQQEQKKYFAGCWPSFLDAKISIGQQIAPWLNVDFVENAQKKHRTKGDAVFALSGFFIHEPDSKNTFAENIRRWQHDPDRCVRQSLAVWRRTALADYILRTLGDGTEMASSIEGRVPFLDQELVQYVEGLPVRFLLRWENDGYIEKDILRSALVGIVPEPVRTRQKQPFLAPPVLQFDRQDPLTTFVFDTLHSQNLTDCFARRQIQEAIQATTQVLRQDPHRPRHQPPHQDAAFFLVTTLQLLAARVQSAAQIFDQS